MGHWLTDQSPDLGTKESYIVSYVHHWFVRMYEMVRRGLGLGQRSD